MNENIPITPSTRLKVIILFGHKFFSLFCVPRSLLSFSLPSNYLVIILSSFFNHLFICHEFCQTFLPSDFSVCLCSSCFVFINYYVLLPSISSSFSLFSSLFLYAVLGHFLFLYSSVVTVHISKYFRYFFVETS